MPREEIDTWATPLILEVNGRAQAIVPAMRRIRGYDLETGSVVWEGDGLTMNPIPSPVYDDGMVYPDERLPGQRPAGGPHRRGARATSTARAPSPGRSIATRRTCRRRSLTDGILYFLKTNSGILSAFDAKTGKPHYQNQRLDGAAERLLVSGRGAGPRLSSPAAKARRS